MTCFQAPREDLIELLVSIGYIRAPMWSIFKIKRQITFLSGLSPKDKKIALRWVDPKYKKLLLEIFAAQLQLHDSESEV